MSTNNILERKKKKVNLELQSPQIEKVADEDEGDVLFGVSFASSEILLYKLLPSPAAKLFRKRSRRFLKQKNLYVDKHNP